MGDWIAHDSVARFSDHWKSLLDKVEYDCTVSYEYVASQKDNIAHFLCRDFA